MTRYIPKIMGAPPTYLRNSNRWLRTVTNLVFIGASLTFLLATWQASPWRLAPVNGSAAAPGIHAGDVAVAQRTREDSLRPGDVIAYYDPSHNYRVSVGRLARTTPSVSVVNSPFDSSLVMGRVDHRIPGLGWLLTGLTSPLGVIVSVYLSAGTILWSELRLLLQDYRNSHYQLHTQKLIKLL